MNVNKAFEWAGNKWLQAIVFTLFIVFIFTLGIYTAINEDKPTNDTTKQETVKGEY